MTGGYRNKRSGTDKPFFSIITVVLNGEKHLEQAIRSVFSNTTEIEYIVIDGASTDGTLKIIQSFDERIALWVSEKDEGIYDAMNKGISFARGEWIGILNADDYYVDGALDLVKRYAELNNSDVIHGDMMVVTGTANARVRPDPSQMKNQPSIFHPTCFVRKSVYETIGKFDTKYRISSDYDFLLRCIDHQLRFQYIPEVLTCFRPGGLSSSCYSNVEGYRIMKAHQTGHQNKVIWRCLKCYVKTFIKKIINLRKNP